MSDLPATNRTMLTEVKPEGVLELYLADLPMPTPKDHEVVVKVQATPINPSDLGLLFGRAAVLFGQVLADVLTFRPHVRVELEGLEGDVGRHAAVQPLQRLFQRAQAHGAPGA